MAIDRAGARRRVKTITGWAAAGAAALTAAFAFGAARGNHAAASTAAPSAPASRSQRSQPEVPDYGQSFAPPAASNEPPAAMSGGS